MTVEESDEFFNRLVETDGGAEATDGGAVGRCAKCYNYYRGIGRDLKTIDLEKDGVCTKHSRKNAPPDTSPGFYNPKIQDSGTEHQETQWDERFTPK